MSRAFGLYLVRYLRALHHVRRCSESNQDWTGRLWMSKRQVRGMRLNTIVASISHNEWSFRARDSGSTANVLSSRELPCTRGQTKTKRYRYYYNRRLAFVPIVIICSSFAWPGNATSSFLMALLSRVLVLPDRPPSPARWCWSNVREWQQAGWP
jgi:hypothetical protein